MFIPKEKKRYEDSTLEVGQTKEVPAPTTKGERPRPSSHSDLIAKLKNMNFLSLSKETNEKSSPELKPSSKKYELLSQD